MIATATERSKGSIVTGTKTPSMESNEVNPLILAAARRGDHVAFVQLFRFYDRRVRHVVWQVLGDRREMEDVLQEIGLRAFRGLPSFRGESGAGTWLCRIAYTSAIDQLRQRSRETALDDEELPESADLDLADATIARMTLDEAFAALSPDQRIALLLVDREGLDYGDAAEILGVAPGTVASRLSRARAAVRAALQYDTSEVRS